jgi:hypothetical protein
MTSCTYHHDAIVQKGSSRIALTAVLAIASGANHGLSVEIGAVGFLTSIPIDHFQIDFLQRIGNGAAVLGSAKSNRCHRGTRGGHERIGIPRRNGRGTGRGELQQDDIIVQRFHAKFGMYSDQLDIDGILGIRSVHLVGANVDTTSARIGRVCRRCQKIGRLSIAVGGRNEYIGVNECGATQKVAIGNGIVRIRSLGGCFATHNVARGIDRHRLGLLLRLLLRLLLLLPLPLRIARSEQAHYECNVEGPCLHGYVCACVCSCSAVADQRG